MSRTPPSGMMTIKHIDRTAITKLIKTSKDTGARNKNRDRQVSKVRRAKTTTQTLNKSIPILVAPASLKY